MVNNVCLNIFVIFLSSQHHVDECFRFEVKYNLSIKRYYSQNKAE